MVIESYTKYFIEFYKLKSTLEEEAYLMTYLKKNQTTNNQDHIISKLKRNFLYKRVFTL